ncbi:uncharacterized protein MYCGRDRAFT_109668 [Zymoseptoria tritici IPO323]|uniref:Uncharacterized protein n=1 Tax=Zymoseptoria tritici (strain CBS 115943 / IPO323) TaxID=336722 RepID=F9XCH3_ZYMTI|nr:uncharacterized protein MYCGRDRAFT_109668 [Zymoseptoria tritici IPO323]EGP87419.1 hypothetical protein MYCGRDRAFT_109668 [Zymoseptoria tritici IPO323]
MVATMDTTHSPVHVLDDYYLAITLLLTIAYQLIGFSIAFSLKFDKLTDLMGGSNFVWLAILTLSFSGTLVARNIVISIFIMLWGTRLSAFLLFRILKTGSDDRFDDKRDKFFPFLGFWVFQMLWCWTVSLPVTIINSPRVLRYPQPNFGKATDIISIIIFAIAFVMEAVSDVQKYRFKQSPAGKQKGAVCDVGFFKWSRHPNYFGEIAVQFSIYLMAITPAAYDFIPNTTGPAAALYASIVGFLFLTLLLLFVSGLTLQERPGAKKRYEKGEGWHAYAKYLEETSILIPMPKAVWKRLPVIVKRTVGMEWPIYVFDPEKHADLDKVRQQQEEEGRAEREGSGNGNGNERQSEEPLR